MRSLQMNREIFVDQISKLTENAMAKWTIKTESSLKRLKRQNEGKIVGACSVEFTIPNQ